MRKHAETLVIFAIVAAVLGVILIGIDKGTPNSTEGVKDLGGRTALVPAGETLVVVHSIAKAREVMNFTYDGTETVSIDCTTSLLCYDPPPAHLCRVGGCEVTVDAGVFVGQFYITRHQDKTVTIRWQWGWDFRPYRP